MKAHDLDFTNLVDLASRLMGGRALSASDDFFAEKERLLEPGRGVFDPDAYTERGKLMDGWESRRKRTPGHDWCIIRLGVPGRVRALDIDTNHFLGNHPPFASVEGAKSESDIIEEGAWKPLLSESPLRPGSRNLFLAESDAVFTHLRLNIFPDGGVARLRAYGEVAPDWSHDSDEETRPLLRPDEVDLAAVKHGALALACSDSFFGPMNNLISPGRADNMGGGWETRRRRAYFAGSLSNVGFDWIVVRLAGPGTISLVEIDTNHFKGNFPDRASLEAVHAPGARLTDLVTRGEWTRVIGEQQLRAHHRHFYRDEIAAPGPFTHVRLSIYPDGGVSRLRVYGARA
jgi:allantoicase